MAGDNLPDVHRTETDSIGPVDRLEAILRRLDGPMSVSNRLVPFEAYDVGDGADVRANPRASDLGYPEGTDIGVHQLDQETIFLDSALGTEHAIHVDNDTLIEDLSKWN